MSRWCAVLAASLFLATRPATPAAAAQQTGAANAEGAGRWAAEFARFDAADRESPPRPNGFVFVGSSSIRFWNTLQEDFPNLNVLNRGFGGSRISDVREHLDRLVIAYKPQMVLVYAGDNDLAAGRTADDVVADYKAIVARLEQALPNARVAWISIKPSPSRWRVADQTRAANAEIERFTRDNPRLLYIDVFNPMIGANGLPIPELFVADSLHMTPAGYVLWQSIVNPYVQPQFRPRPPDPTLEEVAEMMRRISNWGRWGDNDERGTINLITPEKRLQAIRLAREGLMVSLARTMDKEVAPDNPTPFKQEFQMRGDEMFPYAMDIISSTYHGTTTTHLDALCHYQFEGQMFNGYSYQEFYQATATRPGYGEGPGCMRNSVIQFKDGILTRGILVDLPLLYGVKWLEPGTAVTGEDLEAWERFTGLTIQPGDAVFLRTGRFARRSELGPWAAARDASGFHVSAMPWFKQRDVALLSSDIIQDLQPSNIQGLPRPIHMVSINSLGMPLIDVTDLEAVADVAARLGRWEFMLTVAPLPAPGGSGSPVNPVATF
jgi:lysophospholipase L1-like esterase/kynurenine formamidase